MIISPFSRSSSPDFSVDSRSDIQLFQASDTKLTSPNGMQLMGVFQVFQLYTSRTLTLNLIAVSDDLCIREILFETSLRPFIDLPTCRKWKRSLNSLERKQIHVVNKRLYVPSLTPKHTHTSATSKPGLK